MPLISGGHRVLAHYPDDTSKVLTLYAVPVVGQVIAHGWRVTAAEPSDANVDGVRVRFEISVDRGAAPMFPRPAQGAAMANLDLLVYRDFSDTFHPAIPAIGSPAAPWLGAQFDGLHVAAISKPIHEGRLATVVLAQGTDGMLEVQNRLDGSA